MLYFDRMKTFIREASASQCALIVHVEGDQDVYFERSLEKMGFSEVDVEATLADPAIAGEAEQAKPKRTRKPRTVKKA